MQVKILDYYSRQTEPRTDFLRADYLDFLTEGRKERWIDTSFIQGVPRATTRKSNIVMFYIGLDYQKNSSPRRELWFVARLQCLLILYLMLCLLKPELVPRHFLPLASCLPS